MEIDKKVLQGIQDVGIRLEEAAAALQALCVTISSTKAAPKYPVGSWVVPPNGKPAKITQYDSGVYWVEGVSGWVESDLHPAVREDFMTEFGGVKVWMETDERHTYGCFIMGRGTAMRPVLNPVEVLIYRAAGIMDMPKEFWK